MSNGTPMNVDAETGDPNEPSRNGSISPEVDRTDGPLENDIENDDDEEMGPEMVREWLVEDGWFITTPVPATTDNSLPRDEDTIMSESLAPAPGALDEPPSEPTNTASRYPRTSRFTDSQIRDDERTMQELMNTLQTQVDESAVTASNAESVTVFSNDVSTPHRSQPDSSFQVNQDAISSTNESRSEDPSGSLRNSSSTSNPQVDGTNGGITHNDFMRFVRSVESLSVNVRVLLGQGGNFNGRPGRNNSSHQGNGESRELLDEDGEPEEAQVRVRRKRSVEENRVHDVLRNLLVDYNLRISKRRKQMRLKDCVSKTEVEDFEAGRHAGPNLSDLRIDWTDSMTSQWNSAAIYILADHVLDRIKNSYYPELKHAGWMTTQRMFEELKEKLVVSKEDYEDGADSNAHEINVSVAENRARHAAKKCLIKTRNRRNMRRKSLYDCRLKIINENLGSFPAWETALQLMNVIGDGAMSDDETDEERSTRRKKVVRRVQKPWTSIPLSNMLNTLDLYYSRFYWDGLQKPGPGPRDRLTTIVSESPRPTPKSLPGNCYNTLYLSSLTPYKRSLLRIKRDMIIPTLPLPPA